VNRGNGKGKTTAAFGLAIRACMAGKKVFIGQFMKSIQYNETRIAKFIDNLSIEQFGNGCLLTRAPSAVDKQHAQDGLARCSELLSSGEWDVVIFDEITIALHMELISIDELMQALRKQRPKNRSCAYWSLCSETTNCLCRPCNRYARGEALLHHQRSVVA